MRKKHRTKNRNWMPPLLLVCNGALDNCQRHLILIYLFAVQSTTTKQPEKKSDIGKEAAMEAEVRAAKERALVPLEIRVKSFKEMLKEKDVSGETVINDRYDD